MVVFLISDFPSIFVNPLRVAHQSSGKCRLSLDLSFVNRFFWSSLFGTKIFALRLICFSQVISPLISNLVIVTLKFVLIIASVWAFLFFWVLQFNHQILCF